MPLVSTPISVLITKMPPSVTASIEKRNGQLPRSPPMVPGSSVRMSDAQAISRNPGRAPASLAGASASSQTRNEIAATSSPETTASHAMSAIGPREIERSKA